MLESFTRRPSLDQGIAVMRQQRQISYLAVAAALDRVRNERDEPLFVAKGGIAMELRLLLRARATQDIDATLRASMEPISGS